MMGMSDRNEAQLTHEGWIHQAGWSSGPARLQQRGLKELKHPQGLLAGDGGNMIETLIQGEARFQDLSLQSRAS